MPDWDPEAFTNQLLADMRAHNGEVTQGPLAGHPLLLMTSKGAKSGQPRRAILTFWRQDGDYIVAGTAGGSPRTPSWVYNVQTNPDVEVEAENRTFNAKAHVVDEAERDRLWKEHVARLPWFGEYPKKTSRQFPIVRLTPKNA